MIDDKRERRTALWWIEHESTNEFWSLRNPWVVGPLVLLVVIVLCALATFFWGMPRVVADVITKGIVFGYLLILFIYQLRAKRRTAAIGTAVIALFWRYDLLSADLGIAVHLHERNVISCTYICT